MSLLRSFPIAALALTLLSIVGFCAAEESVELLLVATTLTALSWYVTEGPRGRTLPRWVSNLLVLAAGLSVVVDLLIPPNDIAGVLGRFSVWLTLIKLYERRTARDHAHLMGLSLLLMIVGCLRTQELLFGIVLVLYVLLGLYVLLLYQLYAAREAETLTRRAAPDAPGLDPFRVARGPTIGRHVGLQFRLLAVAIATIGLTLSAVMFVIFPRTVGRGMLVAHLPLPVRSAVSGYADEVDLDAGTRINESRRVVLDLQITDAEGRRVHREGPIYLRGAVLDRYETGRWSRGPTVGGRQIHEMLAHVAVRLGTDFVPAAPDLRQVYRFRDDTSTVFTIGPPASLTSETPHRFEYLPSTHTLRSADPAYLYGYTIGSYDKPNETQWASLARRVEPAPAHTPAANRPGGPRIRRLAHTLLGRAGVPTTPPDADEPWHWNLLAARVFRTYLRSDAFRYTLDLSDVVRGDTDPVVHFLLEDRQGHCEFFASGLVALCDAVAIDARLVTGYVAREYDAAAERYIIRDAHAHAWTEVRGGPFSYLVIDPTPPSILASLNTADLALTDRFEWLYERLEGNWTSGIIQFDGRSQAELLVQLDRGWSRRTSALVQGVTGWMARVNRGFHLGPAGYIWLGIVGIAGVIAIIAVIKLVRRYRVIRRTLHLDLVPAKESGRLIRQLGFYPDMLDVLRRSGLAKPAWQPPLTFATAIATAQPHAADLVNEISGLYYDARFARRRLRGEEVTRAAELVRALDRVLRRP